MTREERKQRRAALLTVIWQIREDLNEGEYKPLLNLLETVGMTDIESYMNAEREEL